MSPIPPPPAGVFVPSDDWSDDPSFDFDSNSPSAQAFALALPPSPSSSSSSSHHSRTQRPSSQHHVLSPLRNLFTGLGGTLKLRGQVDLNDVDFGDDFDLNLPDTDDMTFPAQHSYSRSRPRSSTSSSITRTVIGQGPSGVGTITKLNSGPMPPIITGSNSVKARAKAIEQSWEADLDFNVDPTSHSHTTAQIVDRARRLTLSPPLKKSFMPPADALDDLGFDLDDEEDQDQATLKAGATIKAMLPPPRNKQPVLLTLPRPITPPAQDPDTLELEADFALPLNLTNLTLATQPHVQKKKTLRPRSSVASTAESWDSPGTSHSGKKGWGWGSEDSPIGAKRMSETSVTSVSDGSAEPTKPKAKRREDDDFGDEEDMEADLVIPSPTFFSNKRADELNLILDRKRKPQFAPQTPHAVSAQNHSPRAGDDSFEDGLLLDEPGVELSRHRLREKKRARDKTPSASSSRRAVGVIPGPKTVAKERVKSWEKQREQNWGRNTPVQFHAPSTSSSSSNTKERTQSSLALGLSFRSNSASASALMTLRDGSSRRTDSPSLTSREREAMRSRSGHLLNTLTPMAPPPIPPTSTQRPTLSASSRLRHQKSHYHIAAPPPQSPNLTRKQSLASLQDALASTSASASTLHLDKTPIADPSQTSRYHNSTSRLTMPTSSSRAKARPPLTAVFPKSDFTPSSSASSVSSIGVTTPRHRHQSTPKLVDVPRKKAYGDGTELDSIDDLMVEDDRLSGVGIGLGKPGRRPHDQHTHQQPQPQRTQRIDSDKRKKSGSGAIPSTSVDTGSGLVRRNRRKPAGLIKHLGGADKKKVIGEMTWNPATLRWEGNEGCLKDFDVVSSSARPALITHYTGSSIGMSSPVNSTHPTVNSGSGGGAPRIVGDMQFDPINMRWVSILSAEDEEPDPFEGMADDEDDEGGQGGATITRAQGRRLLNINPSGSGSGSGSVAGSSAWSSRLASDSSISLSSISNSTSTIGNGNPSWKVHAHGVEMPEALWKECKEAEERHKKEMKGWIMRPPNGVTESRERERKEEKRLWEIRHLALKS